MYEGPPSGIAAGEAVVGVEEELGRGPLDRHPLVEGRRLDVPVHRPPVAEVGERVGAVFVTVTVST